MVKLVRQTCYECGEPIVRYCDRCEDWNVRIRSFYAGRLDHELQGIMDGFTLRQRVA
jgi:hypothetical protein